MPQPPAYAAAEVILAGQKLESSAGVVTQASLHAALGGRGVPSTVWRVWSEYAELRGPWTPLTAAIDPDQAGLSPTAARAFSDAVAAVMAFGKLMSDETEEKHTLRAAQAVRAQDDVLATAARLGRELERREAEIAALRAELEAARAQSEIASAGLPLRGPTSRWGAPVSARTPLTRP